MLYYEEIRSKNSTCPKALIKHNPYAKEVRVPQSSWDIVAFQAS